MFITNETKSRSLLPGRPLLDVAAQGVVRDRGLGRQTHVVQQVRVVSREPALNRSALVRRARLDHGHGVNKHGHCDRTDKRLRGCISQVVLRRRESDRELIRAPFHGPQPRHRAPAELASVEVLEHGRDVTYLSYVKCRSNDDRFPLPLWEVWLCSQLGVPIPELIGPLRRVLVMIFKSTILETTCRRVNQSRWLHRYMTG